MELKINPHELILIGENSFVRLIESHQARIAFTGVP